MAVQRARIGRPAMIGLIGLSAMASAAQGPLPAALGKIGPGQWRFRDVDAGNSRAICLGDPRLLIQLGHAQDGCSRFVIDDSPTKTTVRYTCPGSGYGRTTVSVETSDLIHVRTQGVLGGAPFDSDYEGRRSGACPES